MGILGRDVAVSLHPLWNSGIPGIMGILGRDVAVSLHPLWNSGIPGIMGILGRNVISLGPLEFRNSGNYGNSGKRCHITGPWNSVIPGIFGILGRDVISLEMTDLISSVDPRPSLNSPNSAK